MTDRAAEPSAGPDISPGTARQIFALAAIFLAAAMLQAADGAVGTGLPTRIGVTGFAGDLADELASGIGTAYWLGYLAGCFGNSRIVRRVGHIRVFAAAAAACCIAVLAIDNVPPVFWIGTRFVMGVMVASLWAVTDSWIGDKAPPAMRGTVLALYGIVGALGAFAGQNIVSHVDVLAPVFVMIIAALYAGALIPISLTRTEAPLPPATTSLVIRRMFATAPTAAFGCMIVGTIFAVFMSMVPYYMTQVGLPPATIGTAIGAAIIGRLILQWPIGRLSDRVDRRLVLLIAALASAGAMLAMILVGDGTGGTLLGERGEPLRYTLYAIIGFWGGVSLTLYPVCIAIAHDRFPREDMVAVTNTALLLYACGAVAGPILATLSINIAGNNGIGYLFMLVVGILALLSGHGMHRREKPAEEERVPFVDMPATSTELATLRPEAENAAATGADAGDAADIGTGDRAD